MFADPEKVLPYFAIAEGARVADFGVGGGAYSLALARRVGPRGRVYAVDVQAGLLERLAKEARQVGLSAIQVTRGDVEKSGGSQLATASAEAVLLANILFQSAAKYSLALEAKRVLQPGGRVIVVERQVESAAIKAVMNEAGLQFVNEFPFHGLIFKKP